MIRSSNKRSSAASLPQCTFAASANIHSNVSASMGRSSSASTKQSGNEADKGLSIPPSNSMEAHNNFAPSDSPANN